MVLASKYLASLPEPWEIPKLRQKDVQRVYETFTSTGKPDKEALDEVESRLIARMAIWLDLNNLREYTEFVGGFEMGTDRGPESGETAITLTDEREIPVPRGVDIEHNEVRETLEAYRMEASDAWGDVAYGAYQELIRARKSRNYTKRMLAIDRAITIIHHSGWSLVDSFVESDPIRADEFLNLLSAGKLSGRGLKRPEKFESLNRRPRSVRVRSHRRQT